MSKKKFEVWNQGKFWHLSQVCRTHIHWDMTFFVETNILNIHLFTILNLTLCCVNMNWSHRKWHNSVIMSPSDLGQVSKFSLVQNLKLFLWHPKDLFSRKNILRKPKYFWKKRVFFGTPFTLILGKDINLNSKLQRWQQLYTCSSSS